MVGLDILLCMIYSKIIIVSIKQLWRIGMCARLRVFQCLYNVVKSLPNFLLCQHKKLTAKGRYCKQYVCSKQIHFLSHKKLTWDGRSIKVQSFTAFGRFHIRIKMDSILYEIDKYGIILYQIDVFLALILFQKYKLYLYRKWRLSCKTFLFILHWNTIDILLGNVSGSLEI